MDSQWWNQLLPSHYGLQLMLGGVGLVGRVGQGRFGSGVSVPPPLDTVTGSAAAYSLRRVRAAYAGSAIRVRRSNDNAEADIGFVSGRLDTAALLAHCGANSGSIVTWYDQSGNNRNMGQGTAAQQPRIVVGGVLQLAGTLPAIVCESLVGNHNLTTPTWGTIAQPFSRNAVVRMPASITNFTHLINTETGTPNTSDYVNAGSLISFAGSNGPSVLVSTNERLVYTTIYNGASSVAVKNGTSSGTSNPGSNANAGISLNRNETGSVYGDFIYQEVVVFDRALSTPDRQFLERNQGAYYGITVA